MSTQQHILLALRMVLFGSSSYGPAAQWVRGFNPQPCNTVTTQPAQRAKQCQQLLADPQGPAQLFTAKEDRQH